MANINDAFQPESGINFDDLVGVFAGTTNPSVVGEVAPIGSLFISSDGRLYQKIGAADTAWMVFSQGLGEAVKISATDTTSNYLNLKLDTTANLTKTVINAGGNEQLQLDLADLGTPGTYTSVTVDSKGRITAGSNPGFITGNETITISGDATGSGTTSIPLTLVNTGVVAGSYTNTNLTVDSKGRITSIANGIVGAGAMLVYYQADTNGRTITSVTSGHVGWDTATQLSATQVFINKIDHNMGTDFTPYLSTIVPNSILWIQDKDVSTTYQRWLITSVTQGTTAFAFGVTLLDGTAQFANNHDLAVGLQFAGTQATVTSVDIAVSAEGLTVDGGPITTSGTFTLGLSNDLAGLEGLTGQGFSVRTAADTWATRALDGTTNRITITNGDGIASNPTVDIASTYVGQTSITTLGTITTGVWNGATIATSQGGTGRTSIGSANQVLAVNTTGTGLEYKTIQTTGAGLNLNAVSGLITIQNTGVTSITGTANQVNASASTGAVTLSLPQSIATTSSPTFAQVTVAADPTAALQVATKQYVDNVAQSIKFKQSVRAATTINLTSLSGLQTIDGVVLVEGDRVLVKDQSAPATNGIYIASAGTWTRSVDTDTWAELVSAFTFVEEGTINADTGWVCSSNQGGTLETTAVAWALFTSAASITAGTGLTRVGNTISIANIGTAGSYNNVTTNAQGQVISGSTVAYLTANQNITLQGDVTGSGTTLINTTLSNTGVAAGTYKSVTVDAKGRVTAGTNPTTLAGYGITDAQPLNTYLTSVSGLATNGIVIRSGNTAITRAIQAGSTKISVVNGDGTAGNPTIDVAEANLNLNNIGGTLSIAKGGTGLTALGTANQILGVNAGATGAEYKTLTAGTGINIANAAGSITISATNTGTVTSVAATGSTGLTVGGSPITSSGTLTFTLGTELQGLSGLAANGLVTRTAAGTYTSRSVTSPNATISITNPAGTAGNIGLDLATVGIAGTYRSVTTDIYGRVTAGTNPTTLAGYGITDAVNTSQLGAANGVATLDASGKLPTTQLPALAISDVFTVASQTAMLALTAQTGDFAIRTDLGRTFVLSAEPATTLANWVQLADGPSGTVTSVAATQPAAGLTISGSPITSSGTLTFALANDLAAIEGLTTTGLAVRTGTDTWTTRTLVAGSGITITNADGVAGNITISATGGGGSGTVTSVGLALPSIFTVSGSPVTTAGTLSATLNTVPSNTVWAGSSVAGQTVTPTFRTIGLAQGDLNDVTITSATVNQVLAYNGTRWVNTGAVGANAAGLIGVGQTGAAAWTLLSGTRYYADFAHNLGTTNVVITVFDSSTNAVVIPDSTVLTNANTVRITVVGNTRTLKVVVVANGQSIVAGGSTPSSVITAKDGVTVSTAATKLNFTGQAVGVVDAGGGTTNVTIGARYSYFANSLDTPNNADFAVNALAPVTTDPTYPSLNVRTFSNTTEQGVGFACSIPLGATTATFKFRGRAQTAPGAASVVQPRLYYRLLPNNAAVGAWSAAQELANISIPTNAFFQYAQQTISLATLGLTAGNLYQFELTRRVTGVTGTNLAANFLLAEVTVEFA